MNKLSYVPVLRLCLLVDLVHLGFVVLIHLINPIFELLSLSALSFFVMLGHNFEKHKGQALHGT